MDNIIKGASNDAPFVYLDIIKDCAITFCCN